MFDFVLGILERLAVLLGRFIRPCYNRIAFEYYRITHLLRIIIIFYKNKKDILLDVYSLARFEPRLLKKDYYRIISLSNVLNKEINNMEKIGLTADQIKINYDARLKELSKIHFRGRLIDERDN